MLFVSAVTIVGVAAFWGIHAQGPYGLGEAESGALTNSASAVTDNSASGGSYVKFGTQVASSCHALA